MEILGQNFKVEDIFDNSLTIPDCFVVNSNKLGKGNGEAKLYIAPKEKMNTFFGNRGFNAKCFVLKDDLITYMNAIESEYKHPELDYRDKAEMPRLWAKRMAEIQSLPSVIEFSVQDQTQIEGVRGYVNSRDYGYKLIRTLSLPLITYISVMRLTEPNSQTPVFYWKLFADREIIAAKRNGALVFTYGKGKGAELIPAAQPPQQKNEEISKARLGQGKYRELMLQECPFCPITRINDERLLIASQAKPWAESNDREKIDPKNGLILSPLFDKLFDKGFMTFTDTKDLVLSNWITPSNYKRMGLDINEHRHIEILPFDEARLKYIHYHREHIFKG